MPKIRFDCDCGRCEAVIVDGYEVAEKLLEGVEFMVTLKDGRAKAKLKNEADAEYFSQFNKKKYLQEVATFIEDTDVATCLRCGSEASIVVVDKQTQKKALPVEIPKCGAMELLGFADAAKKLKEERPELFR